MNNAEEVIKSSRESKWATLGRAMADYIRMGKNPAPLINEAATLRQLEQNDCVTSEWDVTGKGPAKRVYCLTPHGEDHLVEWITVLDHVARSMTRFVRTAGKQSRDESEHTRPTPLCRTGKRTAKTA